MAVACVVKWRSGSFALEPYHDIYMVYKRMAYVEL
jgi:hypothetical protein